MSAPHPYRGARAVLATMHGKEAAIAPPFLQSLGMVVEAGTDIDTDALGTFSGEIPRVGTMGEVAIKKARLAMAACNVQIGLASEGAFGAHPVIPFIPGGIELLMFVDDERGFTVSEGLTAERTNYGHAVTKTTDGLDDFLQRSLFPSHALIVQPNQGKGPIFKAVIDHDALNRAVACCAGASADERALVQTDMRAHMNPTRMDTLRELAERLAVRLNTLCPGCGTPGFGRVRADTGLPCAGCGAPTEMVQAEIFGCPKCDYKDRRQRADGRSKADPTYCPWCNP